MTKQASDEFLVEGQAYVISAFTGRGIFCPQDYGMSPRWLSTACYRGFRCCYSVEDGWLYLRELIIGVIEPMWLLGAAPVPEEEGGYGLTYEDLPEPIPFSGGILAARRDPCMIRAPFDNLAMESLIPFRLLDGLCELRFEAGMLLEIADRSAAVEDLGERIRLGGDAPPVKEAIESWLEAEFTERGYVNYDKLLYGELW